ncbi:MAG TPA: LapA family protein [Burkholderiales bacterium]|nr:LapA family protein [Burkholderiales bacterium]
MRLLTWTIRIALFILLLAFAARNTETVTLRFYFDLAWQAPLVVLLLAFFAAGAVLGLLAALGAVLRQRREAARLRRELRAVGARTHDAPTLPPPPAEG